MAVKRVSGGYSLLPAGPAVALAAAQPSGELGKLSFSVRAPVPCSFDANVIFMTGRLRVGYLRSYEGQASIEVQVYIPPSHGGIANASWVVNGTREDRVSSYTSDDFELSVERRRGGVVSLSEALLRALIAAPTVAVWAVLPRCSLLDRLTLKVCRVVYP